MSNGHLCGRPGCREFAMYQVHIRAVAIVGKPSADIVTSLLVCGKHDGVALSDLFTLQTWRDITNQFALIGKMRPVYSKSYTFLVPISEDNPPIDPNTLKPIVA